MSALPAGSAAEWAAAVRSGALDPRAGLGACLAAAAAHEPRIHALLGTEAAAAGRRAEEIAAMIAAGTDPGPLAGVPFVLKDNIAVADWPLTCGSRILEGFRSTYSATVVERLLAAGAIPFARANLDEFAMGASTENSAFGPSHNPHDPARVPGGSSGGSAAAVAAGYAPFALGSETGGSVRQPASFCGLYGLKPTYGRLSRYGLVAFASSLDQIGVFGRTVEDLALIFDAIAGPDPRDATTLRDAPAATRPNLDAGVQGLRVGLLEHAAAEAVEADTRAAVQRAAAALTAAGALVEPVAPAHAEAVVPVYYLLNTAEASANLARYDGVRYGLRRGEADGLQEMIQGSREAGFGAEVKRRILLGTFSLSAGYHEQYFGAAQRARRLLLQTEAALYQRFDLLLGPTTPGPAFRLGEKAADPVAMYLCDVFTCGANLTGAPALNLPAGRGADGLPRGVQLHAPPRAEARLLQAARALVPALGTSLLADLGPAPVPGGAR